MRWNGGGDGSGGGEDGDLIKVFGGGDDMIL